MTISPQEWVTALASTIRAERTARRWKQAELADRVGMSRATLIRFESGERIPDIAQMASVAEAFGMSLGELLEAAQRRLPTPTANGG